MRNEPYKDATTPGLYTAYLTTPGVGIEVGWSAHLPAWSKYTLLENTYWQWIGLVLLLLFLICYIAWLFFLARQTSRNSDIPPSERERRGMLIALLFGLVLVGGADYAVDEIINLTGDSFVAMRYIFILLRYFLLGWIVTLAGNTIVNTVIRVRQLEHTATALLLRVSSWIVVGFTLVGLVVAVAQSFGFPAYSIVTGLGVGGVAIGFGAQSLVRDVLAGMFFLVDDAFREGDYIEVGDARGSVEKISVRSMQLRHHMGPVHTLPYGEINQLTNYSRDWVIIKLKFLVTIETDPNVVKKVFKKIGAEMAEDPLFKDDFLQPFKSQGVYDIDDRGMVIRGKFMAKPGTQFTIKKEILNRVKTEFAAAGVDFARREVRVEIPGLKDFDELSDPTKSMVRGVAAVALD
jgi:small-conductance mechanosensitive channel